jgi:hypothetical protein
MDFTFVQLRINGTLHAILVERKPAEHAQQPAAAQHQRAYIRLV